MKVENKENEYFFDNIVDVVVEGAWFAFTTFEPELVVRQKGSLKGREITRVDRYIEVVPIKDGQEMAPRVVIIRSRDWDRIMKSLETRRLRRAGFDPEDFNSWSVVIGKDSIEVFD